MFGDQYHEDVAWEETEVNHLYELDERPPYSLWVAETPDGVYTGLISHSETSVRGVVINDSEQCQNWALEQFERYREQATLIEALSERA